MAKIDLKFFESRHQGCMLTTHAHEVVLARLCVVLLRESDLRLCDYTLTKDIDTVNLSLTVEHLSLTTLKTASGRDWQTKSTDGQVYEYESVVLTSLTEAVALTLARRNDQDFLTLFGKLNDQLLQLAQAHQNQHPEDPLTGRWLQVLEESSTRAGLGAMLISLDWNKSSEKQKLIPLDVQGIIDGLITSPTWKTGGTVAHLAIEYASIHDPK